MRRSDKELPAAEAMEFLAEARDGVLSMVDPSGRPYAVPVNHAVVDGQIVIHCAPVGTKIDILQANPDVCYTAYRTIMIDPDSLNTLYVSAIAFGTAELVEDAATKRHLLESMTEHLAPGAAFTCSDDEVARTGVIRIRVDRITGKANRSR
ncbi:MAG: pyridoxamine 5'-phosphate oxidase family protein [Firmicutes bacterium]|jgi:nitroimidazol reductase NimA-like FMN-containing flavoprotein (pyridoxamine 5'-phosphate oxidase superfamily)|nr:pyridoxamine 5'-phosphate oxidase family protein [Bacillota bacterium]